MVARATYDADNKAVLDDMLLAHPNVRAGAMFGYPAYFAGAKMCICLYEDGVAVKLPEESAQRLMASDPSTGPFTPMGRHTMRAWVLIRVEDPEAYRGYAPVFEESVHHVLSLQKG